LLTRDMVKTLSSDLSLPAGAPGLRELGIDPTPMEEVTLPYLKRFRPPGARRAAPRHRLRPRRTSPRARSSRARDGLSTRPPRVATRSLPDGGGAHQAPIRHTAPLGCAGRRVVAASAELKLRCCNVKHARPRWPSRLGCRLPIEIKDELGKPQRRSSVVSLIRDGGSVRSSSIGSSTTWADRQLAAPAGRPS
jgi:hypothetical protein